MADDENNPTPEPPAPAPPAVESAPQWAIDLKHVIEDLPSKLQATITDADRSGIAEAVHGLFERSGAFESSPPADEKEVTTNETEATENSDDERKPAKKGLSGFAEWFQGGE